MKTKLYNLLTGLLMGACITSYGQEIVSEFTLRNGHLFSDIDIMACSDGTLLTSIYQYNSNYDAVGFLICKTTTEGQLLDSIQLDYGKNLWAINGEADSFVGISARGISLSLILLTISSLPTGRITKSSTIGQAAECSTSSASALTAPSSPKAKPTSCSHPTGQTCIHPTLL